MPEPFTLTVFATIAAHGLFSHGAAHGTAAVVAHAAAAKGAAAVAAKGTAAVAGHAAAGHLGTAAVAGHAAAGHLGTAALVGATITASTLGGATFLNVYNNTLDDLYKNLKRRWKRVPTPGERQRFWPRPTGIRGRS